MVRLRYHGHSCFTIESGPHRILIDPFLTGNPLADVRPEDFTKLDAILITHGHGDHVGDAVAIAKRTGALVVANYEIVTWLSAQGCQGHGMSIGGGHTFPFGHVKLTIAHHGSTGPGGESLGSPTGIVITTSAKKIYHAGDTGLFLDMTLIAERSGPFDVALLPIGDNFTMGVDDAVKAAEFVKAKVAIPMHYDTFDVIRASADDFVSKVRATGLGARVVKPGESYEIVGSD